MNSGSTFLKSKTVIFVLTALVISASATILCNLTRKHGNSNGVYTDSHKKMLGYLAQTKSKAINPDNIYASDARLAMLESKIAKARTPGEKLNFLFQKANTLLEYGDEAASVQLLEQLNELVKSVQDSRKHIRTTLGVAYLRLAERNNCINSHSTEACIMPIQGNGIHQDKSAAQKAVDCFKLALEDDTENPSLRWLLNIAYMTIGGYPTQVPAKWLIKGLDAPGKISVKPFTDMAPDLGLAIKNRAGGVVVDDFDNDGYLDIMNSAWGLDDPMHLFHNNGDGTFQDVSKQANLSDLTGGLNMVQADYNNDGYVDIFVLRGAWQGISGFGEQPNSLLRNNGDGTFTDVTIEAGMLSFRPTQAATWNDFNRDGWLDLFIGNETTEKNKPYSCELYINNKDGSFKEVAAQAKVNFSLFVKGVTSGDYDNDGWPDLFLSCMSGQKVLLRNQGAKSPVPSFENVSQQAGFSGENGRSFPCCFFDFDNDGWLDVFVCNYEFAEPLSFYMGKEYVQPSSNKAGKMYLYHNNGNGTFTDISGKMDVNQPIFAMGMNVGDIDNDGFLDIYLATGNPSYLSLVPNRLYKNMGGQNLVEVTTSARVGNLQKGHGVSFADLNNNGDQDIFVDMGGAYRGDAYYASFYLNPGQSNNNWINIKLEGVKSNRSAIGARVVLKFKENGVERTVYRDVNSGGSFGCSPLRREIGVGSAQTIDEITVIWPLTGEKQSFYQVKSRQFLKIREGNPQMEVLPQQPLVFKRKDGTIPMCAPATL